jgi:hypothetical protein
LKIIKNFQKTLDKTIKVCYNISTKEREVNIMRTIRKLKAMPYAQAHIEIVDDTAYLFSYTTLVASIRTDDEGKWIRCYGLYSATTRKHISAFAKEYGLTFQDFKQYAGAEFDFNTDTGEVVFDEGCNSF